MLQQQVENADESIADDDDDDDDDEPGSSLQPNVLPLHLDLSWYIHIVAYCRISYCNQANLGTSLLFLFNNQVKRYNFLYLVGKKRTAKYTPKAWNKLPLDVRTVTNSLILSRLNSRRFYFLL